MKFNRAFGSAPAITLAPTAVTSAATAKADVSARGCCLAGKAG